MIKQSVFERFELLFWNLAIRVLSGTRAARTIISPVLKSAYQTKAGSLSFLFGLCGLAGLVTGYLFFVITH